jgi:signal transduction histidine kinase/phage shock protein PspC (stress-responsive transcriptional regulator)
MITATARPPLARPRRMVLGGVAYALALHLGWPVGVIRGAFIALTFAGGAGPLLYLWLWALVPLEPEAAPTERGDAVPEGAIREGSARGEAVRRAIPVAAILLAASFIAVVVELNAILNVADGVTNLVLVAVILAAGGAVAWTLALDRWDFKRSTRYAFGVRIGASAVLLFAGIVVLLSRASAANAILGMLAIVVAVVVLIAPRVVTLWRDLLRERSARVRQEQRAEIAAHLHDSVLQTLALIQNRAGPSSEVARIARAQERELRDWLFADDEPTTADFATELREIAAAIELDYAVRIEVVTAGASVGRSNAALVGASREAMLNAARHAGGAVSVYVETPPGAIDVFVRDRGPGVDLAALPADRLGIRESIIGRMTRAGGSATVRAGTGGGTEVQLHLEVARD